MTDSFVPWDTSLGAAPAAPTPEMVLERFAERQLVPPAAYVAFVRAHGGERFRSGTSEIADSTGAMVELGTVYHYDPDQPRYLIDDLWGQTIDELDEKIVPIMTTNYSGLVCLDFRATHDDPPVVTYDFEALPERQIVRIATSFSQLLEKLGLD